MRFTVLYLAVGMIHLCRALNTGTFMRPTTLAKVPLIQTRLFARMRPGDIRIPMDQISFSFARSSGPGGQNVNKLNTKAELRFHVASARWIPEEVRSRLANYQAKKINNDGELLVVSQEHRTQGRNREDCISKLQEMLADAYIEPKERKQYEGIGVKGKAMRKKMKTRRSEVKTQRRQKKFDFD
jgi:peptidyl-tRNA hydrolase ICT1